MLQRKKRFVVWIGPRGKLKIMLLTAAVVFLFSAFSYKLPAAKTWTYWTLPLSGKVIVLDAGHGGPDGGAESRDGLIEKDVTLAISLYLRDYLQQSGAKVIMTRDNDVDLAPKHIKGFSRRKTEDLIKRVQIVNNKHADLLVSIHLNSIPSPVWSGAQTFYYPKYPKSKLLSDLIQDELQKNLQTDRKAKTAHSIYLIKAAEIPSALVEIGFLSNPEEARRMANEFYQRKVAETIYRGILRYGSGEQLVLQE